MDFFQRSFTLSGKNKGHNPLRNNKVVVPDVSWVTTVSPFIQFGFEPILCDADNSNLNNITVAGSSTKNNNGLLVFHTSNTNLSNINSSNNYYGITITCPFFKDPFSILSLLASYISIHFVLFP